MQWFSVKAISQSHMKPHGLTNRQICRTSFTDNIPRKSLHIISKQTVVLLQNKFHADSGDTPYMIIHSSPKETQV